MAGQGIALPPPRRGARVVAGERGIEQPDRGAAIAGGEPRVGRGGQRCRVDSRGGYRGGNCEGHRDRRLGV